MAKPKGLIEFEGTMGGITSYTLNGKTVLRQCRGSEKEKFKTGKNHERTRENMMEFSGAVAAAKVLRQSLAPAARSFSDPGFTGRLQGKYIDLINVSPGKRGQRVFKPLEHAEAICAIPFNKDLHLDSILGAKPVIKPNTDRTAASLSLSLNITTDIYTPAGATHAELIYAIAIQPSFEYDPNIQKYKRTDDLDQHYMQTISSSLISLDVNKTMDILLSPPPIEVSMLHIDSALISVLGIRFHQQIGFKSYPLETGRAMGIVGVN